MSTWVRFDSDESSIPGTKPIVLKQVVEKTLMQEATPKLSGSKINPIPKIDVEKAMVTFTRYVGVQQPDVANNGLSLSEKANMVAASSIHLHRLAVLAQDVTSTDSSKFPSSNHLQNRNSFQPNVNGGSMIQTTGAQLPVQNIQPVKFAVNSAPYPVSSLYTPTIPFKGVSTAPIKRPHTALPVSGYEYDFSFLTQGMFAKR
ncbi:unnamed protein product [Amaranthus hypochondriacus]